jgi:hypothetical protein
MQVYDKPTSSSGTSRFIIEASPSGSVTLRSEWTPGVDPAPLAKALAMLVRGELTENIARSLADAGDRACEAVRGASLAEFVRKAARHSPLPAVDPTIALRNPFL